MATASRRNVELMKVGVWAASSGVSKVTGEDLDSMVAAYNDHIVDRPVIKVGHDDANLFNTEAGVTGSTGYLGDGEPAFGWLANVGRGDGSADRPNPDALYADYVGMPAKFAEVADSAWRRRSVEIEWGVKTAENKVYAAVLTGVALLGVPKPAVKGLSDVLALYSEVPDAEGGATQIVQGDDVPQLDFAALSRFAAAEVRDTGAVPHGSTDRPEGEAVTTTTPPSSERKNMTIKKAEVDAALAKAGEDDVTSILQGLLTPEGDPGTGQGTTTDTTSTSTDTGAGTGAEVVGTITPDALKTAASEAGMVLVTKDSWETTQSQLSQAVAVTDQVTKDRRDGIVNTAFAEGRITGDERKTWREKLDENEGLTVSLLGALTPRFTTTAFSETQGHALPGSGGTSQMSEAETKAWDDFATGLTSIG